MAISDQDIKKLWGLAAGRCSKPGCGKECINHSEANSITLIGEMAHVIAKQPSGPRGIPPGGKDTYDNLILLCPTHHRLIDKYPDLYPSSTLFEWKTIHEQSVKNLLKSPVFDNKRHMAIEILKLLVENKSIWQYYGPESEESINNPISNLNEIWEIKKIDTIIPNNNKIIYIIHAHKHFFDANDYIYCTQFIAHAEGFENCCHKRTEGIPKFPLNFHKVIKKYAEK